MSKKTKPVYTVPARTEIKAAPKRTALLIASGDLRESANTVCWPAQQALEAEATKAFEDLGWRLVRANSYSGEARHGFIASQAQGREVFANIHPETPLVIAEAVWQYSHHVLIGLCRHKGPILILANWSGQWPGLVGALNLRGSLTKAGVEYSLLWGEDFAAKPFRAKLKQWLEKGRIKHDLSHVERLDVKELPSRERKLGEALAQQLQERPAILGVFDEGCMGMFNAIIPDAALHPTGAFKERLSQSALYYAMTQVPDAEADAARHWLDARGMQFKTGPNEETDLTDSQISFQLKMYIAAVRLADQFGCDAIGIQYQQGLKDLCPASDLAEGLLNCSERPPVVGVSGQYIGKVLYDGRPLTHFNEVDECAGLDGLITQRVWSAMSLPGDNTLHDLRWGDVDASGTTDEYVWVFLISGAAPASHFEGSYSDASSERQPAMYFRLGGGTLKGISKAGEVVWSRIYVEPDAKGRERLWMDLGRCKAVSLPADETNRRWKATTPQWPIMHAVLYGISRDQMMAKHQANHIQVVYAPDAAAADRALAAKAAMAEAMGIKVNLCGSNAEGRPLSEALARLRSGAMATRTKKPAQKLAAKQAAALVRAPVLGLDFGTSSVRALVVDALTGETLGSAAAKYKHGIDGVIISKTDPHLARQDPQDYGDGREKAIRSALHQAQKKHKVDPATLRAVGVSATGSTPIPFENRRALGLLTEFRKNPDAMAWLWKDHTAHAEAEEITDLARKQGRPYLSKCGGVYSSEWYWSKILHCHRVNPKLAARANTWMELSDWMPYILLGAPDALPRNLCAAGHKAMYHESWGGLPAPDFLDALHPGLSRLRDDYAKPVASDTCAGTVPAHTARINGLPAGIPVAVGAIDAHLGAVGSGCAPGTLVKIIGTSTCDCIAVPLSQNLPDIRGVCGIAPESILPGHHGIEAGQSAVGDIFNWFVSRVLGHSGAAATKAHAELTAQASTIAPGASGLLTLDWHNGNRTILVDPLLTGLTLGQTLATTPAEIYRSLIEATAFGARMIIDRIAEYGVKIDRVVCCGGIADKNPLLMQVYADVLQRPMHIAASDQACALGAAVMASVAGGIHKDVITAQKAMTSTKAQVYLPNSQVTPVYDWLFSLYRAMHDAFGLPAPHAPLHHVMKELLAIQHTARGNSGSRP